MNLRRGMIAGLIGAVVGAVVPTLVIGLFTILSWYFNDTRELHRRDDITAWRRDGVFPLVGCAIYVGLSAWATYTPAREYRFAKTLSIIFFCSILSYLLISIFDPTPRSYTYQEHTGMTVTDFFRLFTPPLLISIVLVVVRCRKVDPIDQGQSK